MAYGRGRQLDGGEVISSSSLTTIALNASNQSAGVILFFEPGHGSIVSIIFNATAITTPPTFTASLYGVLSRATPNTTIYGSGTATGTVIPAVGLNTVTLGTPYAGTAGDQIAVVINSAAATVGVSATVGTRVSCGIGTVGLPYGIQQVAGTWSAVTAGIPCIGVVYADGTISTGCIVPSSLANTLPGGTAGTYYVASVYSSTISRVCNGVYVSVRVNTGSDFSLSVFSGSSTTPTLVGSAVSVGVDKMFVALGGVYQIFVPFSASLTIVPNTVYRFAVNMNSATAFVTFVTATFGSVSHRQSYSGDMYASVGTNAGVFTDATTAVSPIVPRFDSESAGGGGASRSRIFTEGGMNDK